MKLAALVDWLGIRARLIITPLLAVNARDSMPEGGIVTISTTNVAGDDASLPDDLDPSEDGYVRLAVNDTGIGIKPEVAARVFEPFFTTKGVGQGTGLGLSMVYGFCKQSGGHVSLDSEVGHGTTVTLYLPRAFGAPQGLGDDIATAAAAATSQVLIVEDDEDVRPLLANMLAGMGYSVVAAADATEARQVLKTHPAITLLISDVVLPGGMSGSELASYVRHHHADCRVLLISGYMDLPLRQGTHPGQDERLLQKPFTRESLAAAIQDVLADDTVDGVDGAHDTIPPARC